MIYDNSSLFDNILPSVHPPTENDPCFSYNTAPSLDEWINENSSLIDGEIEKIIDEICEGEKYDIKEIVEEEIDNVIYETLNGDENGFKALKAKLIYHYVKKIQNNV